MAKQYHATKLVPIVKIVADIVQRNPSIADNPDYLMATIASNIPDFSDTHTCINCGANMIEYVYEIDITNAVLLLSMAKAVRERMTELELPFTEANKIHVTSLHTSDPVRHATTQASKLGLIAKYKTGKQQVPGMWVITDRGWSALRGEPVQQWVRVFRGEILDRSEATTTISAVFIAYAERLKKKSKTVKNDYMAEVREYDINEWLNIG